MSRLGDRSFRAFSRLLRVLPATPMLVLVAVLYAGGFALPLAAHWKTASLVMYSLIGSMLSFVILFGWLAVRLEDAERRRFVDWTTNLRLLDSREFEWFVGEIFRREGYEVEETGSQDQPDGNIDLVLRRNGRRAIVQCKRWQAWQVGVDEVRKFAGTLVREGLGAEDGMFVTLSRFGDQAQLEAERMGIRLIDGADLEGRWEKVRRREPCPVCGEPMVVGNSSRGWWLRCVASGCSGKRDLGPVPGRAVELLTEPPGR